MKHKKKIVGIALLCLTLGSEALTLGRIRGAVLIGKPLDVAVQVQMAAGEDMTSLCFDADVFHADTRQEASRVRVLVEASAQAQTANVRILSSALVNEPVVTVYLRSGCSQKSSRRYVLLADFPSELAAPLPALSDAPSATPSAPPPVARRVVPAEAPEPAVRTENPTHRPAKKTSEASPMGVTAGATRRAARAATQPRLKLNLLELMEAREPTLNFSTELLTQPSGNPQRRSEAAALWLALNASPEETLRQHARSLALEADVNALKTLTTRNQRDLTDLSARLAQAESRRFSAWVVDGLVAGLLLSLAALAFLWNRRRRVQAHDNDWWNGAVTLQPPATEPGPAPDTSPIPRAPDQSPGLAKTLAPAAAGLWKSSAVASDMDLSMVEVSHSVTHSIFDDLMQSEVGRATAPNEPQRPVAAVAAQAVSKEADQSSLPNPPALDMLDLDLSELDMGPLVFGPEAITDVDIPLSIPDEPAPDAPQEPKPRGPRSH
ncbi:hypothetical protein SBP18_18040 [Rhodoferax ferrireducens]|uniref:hypothetical protein n=1 Tax=Rhodoferax ferrireducens TaxID=192843 RepID=UPI00298DE652|nr:hypothetical protein [Rhodoferax ferrireducens]WPC66364.1 hypothetical protein SBP18_18040 [Rhodoferax ferrireducens]